MSADASRVDPPRADPRVAAQLAELEIVHEVLPCEPHLADTAAYAAHYGIPMEHNANTIVVVAKRGPRRHVACVVLATTTLDVNGAVRRVAGFPKASFAPPAEVQELTGMEIGGVTAFGLPPELPILVDARVLERPWVILGGGNRTSKLRLDPQLLQRHPSVQVVEGLTKA